MCCQLSAILIGGGCNALGEHGIIYFHYLHTCCIVWLIRLTPLLSSDTDIGTRPIEFRSPE